jgi:hypothetical protein
MRWFKHLSDARNNPKLKRIEKKLGEAGYARAFKLLEVVAERGGTGGGFQPRIGLKDSHTDLEWLADEWGITAREAKKTLDLFASLGFIDPDALKNQTIQIPQMLAYRDEWARKHQHRSNSGGARERHATESELELESESGESTESERESEQSRCTSRR